MDCFISKIHCPTIIGLNGFKIEIKNMNSCRQEGRSGSWVIWGGKYDQIINKIVLNEKAKGNYYKTASSEIKIFQYMKEIIIFSFRWLKDWAKKFKIYS